MSRRAFVTLAQAVYAPAGTRAARPAGGTLPTSGGRPDARRPRC